MVGIHTAAANAAANMDNPGNLMFGANIAGFLKVARAMYEQGVAY
jgi:glutamate dehydrogenase (NADP+)